MAKRDFCFPGLYLGNLWGITAICTQQNHTFFWLAQTFWLVGPPRKSTMRLMHHFLLRLGLHLPRDLRKRMHTFFSCDRPISRGYSFYKCFSAPFVSFKRVFWTCFWQSYNGLIKSFYKCHFHIPSPVLRGRLWLVFMFSQSCNGLINNILQIFVQPPFT